MAIKIGDTVIIKSYRSNELWEVINIFNSYPRFIRLKGVTNRCILHVPENKLEKIDSKAIKEILNNHKVSIQTFFSNTVHEKIFNNYFRETGNDFLFKIPGSILHLDSDKSFMEDSLQLYNQFNIPSNGYFMNSEEIPSKVLELLKKHNPDILVITGHDGYEENMNLNSLASYINSKYYMKAVQEARKFDKNKDSLVIYAGACKSYFEALMAAGANFASSPKRVDIEKFDPAIIATAAALTPFLSKIDLIETISTTKVGVSGIGGIETRGCLRNAIPIP